jgi:hypothetical protein
MAEAIQRPGERVISLLHTQLVQGVQAALAAQLKRDGLARPGMELGLTFYLIPPDRVSVRCRVEEGGTPLFEMVGGPPELAAIATNLALAKLDPTERRGLLPAATVHWRSVRFSADGESVDRFFADVRFTSRQP